MTCYTCGGCGHKSAVCPTRKIDETKWCNFCESHKHDTKSCRNKEFERCRTNAVFDSSEIIEEEHTFAFGVATHSIGDDNMKQKRKEEMEDASLLLVDSGSTSHIINDKNKFISFDPSYIPDEHYIELANGEKVNGIAKAKGTARVNITDEVGNLKEITLSNALYIPTFKRNIFSVRSGGKNGAMTCLGGESGTLQSKGGTIFPIHTKDNLYFLNLRRNRKSFADVVRSW